MKVHLMFMGDKGVGKTCLIIAHTTCAFPGEYIPEVPDIYNCNETIEGHSVDVACHDYDHVTNQFAQSYDIMLGRDAKKKKAALKEFESEPQVYIACFSVVSPPSFDDLKIWMPKAEGHPSIIVGLKTDLREDSQMLENLQSKRMAPITKEQGERLVAEFAKSGCAKYMECSAKQDAYGRDVKAVFAEATKLALNSHVEKHGKEKCIIC